VNEDGNIMAVCREVELRYLMLNLNNLMAFDFAAIARLPPHNISQKNGPGK
jgi:hypothetical protein